MTSEQVAAVCAGECPYDYDCKAMDCEECLKVRADGVER